MLCTTPSARSCLGCPECDDDETARFARLALAITENARERYKVDRKTRHRILSDLATPGTALNEKLTRWWELPFPVFLKEVNKALKREIPIRQRDEWEEWLALRKAEQTACTEEIVRLEEQLNRRVYALFDLTRDQVEIVEESTQYRYGEV